MPFLSLLCVIVGYSNIHKKDNKKRLKIIGKIFADIKYLVYLCSAFGNSPNVLLKYIKLWKNFSCISSVSHTGLWHSFCRCCYGQMKTWILRSGWFWRWYQIFGFGCCLLSRTQLHTETTYKKWKKIGKNLVVSDFYVIFVCWE